MQLLFILCAVVLLPISAFGLCPSGCSCFDDSPCQYYCNSSRCQPSRYLWSKCSGHYMHPRECGSVSYCDPDSSYTCQLQKNIGVSCTYDWSCLSGNCDYRSQTCQSVVTTWALPIVLPCVFGGIIFICVLVALIARAQRRRAAVSYYQNPYIIMPGSACSYQNSYCVGEASPPPYPGHTPVPPPKTYQG